MRRLLRQVKQSIFERLIQPLFESVAPVHEAALGAAIGMFIGMTPTVGIQMWVVFLIWLSFRYGLKQNFDLIIGTALVWISNPFTMFFLYYGFLMTGNGIFAYFGKPHLELSFTVFRNQLSHIVNAPDAGTLEIITDSMRFLLVDLGFPMLVGSLVYAFPLSLVSYFLVRRFLLLYRHQRAKKLGMDYEEWRARFERGYRQ